MMNTLSKSVFFVVFYLLISFFSTATTAKTSPPQYDDALMQKMILQYVNAYRAQHHLTPLQLNSTASHEATIHSQNMANKKIGFGHAHFNHRIQRLYKKLNPCRGGAENVAFYQYNAKRLVDGWIASPGHRRNIEGHYNVTGIGIAHGRTGWAYFTQIFVQTDNVKYA